MSELLWRVQVSGEGIEVTRRGKVVAVLEPVVRQGDWVSELMALAEAYPEECRELGDELDRIYAERRRRKCPYDVCPVDGEASLPQPE